MQIKYHLISSIKYLKKIFKDPNFHWMCKKGSFKNVIGILATYWFTLGNLDLINCASIMIKLFQKCGLLSYNQVYDLNFIFSRIFDYVMHCMEHPLPPFWESKLLQ